MFPKIAISGSLYLTALLIWPSCAWSVPTASNQVDVATALKSPNVGLRKAAAARLGQTRGSRQAAALLKTLLQDSSAEVRAEAIKSLGQIGPAASDAVPSLVALLDDPTLLTSSSDRKVDMTDAVIQTLGQIGPSAGSSAQYLVSMLNDRTQFYRRAKLLKALQLIGPPEAATPIVMRIVKEEARGTQSRADAIGMLGQIKPPAIEAIPLLNEISTDERDAGSRKLAQETLLKIENAAQINAHQSAGVAEVCKTLKALHSTKEDKLKALEKAEQLGPLASGALPYILESLTSADVDLRLAAMEAVAEIGPSASAALPQLVSYAVLESNTSFRTTAFAAIARIDPKGERVVPMLKEPLGDPFKARNAIELLERIGTRETSQLADTARRRWCIR